MISLALRLDLWLLWVYKTDSRPALTGLGTSGDLRFDLKVGYVIQEEGSRLLSLIPGSSHTGFGIWTSRLDLKPSLAWVLQPCHVILERCFTPVCIHTASSDLRVHWVQRTKAADECAETTGHRVLLFVRVQLSEISFSPPRKLHLLNK